jgi:hypothetical protein
MINSPCQIFYNSVADSEDFWSDPDYLKRPDPDPDLNNISAKLLLEIFGRKYALKSIFMNQKVENQIFLNYLSLLHTKKVDIGALITARIRIWIRPKRSGSDRIRICNTCAVYCVPFEFSYTPKSWNEK